MTGRICFLDPLDLSGYINAENGSRVRFHLTSLIAYDIGRVAVGQFVTFDLRDIQKDTLEAINVSVRAAPDGKSVPLLSAAPLRYSGFSQKDNIRTYRFERAALGQPVQTITVRVDMRLLTLRHVSIQDCLEACCQIVSTGSKNLNSTEPRTLDFQLGETELAAYLAGKPVSNRPKHGIRKASALQQFGN